MINFFIRLILRPLHYTCNLGPLNGGGNTDDIFSHIRFMPWKNIVISNSLLLYRWECGTVGETFSAAYENFSIALERGSSLKTWKIFLTKFFWRRLGNRFCGKEVAEPDANVSALMLNFNEMRICENLIESFGESSFHEALKWAGSEGMLSVTKYAPIKTKAMLCVATFVSYVC